MAAFSNTDRDVFLVKLERMIDRGALLSRYSRTANIDIRDVYHKEFESDQGRGADFYRRVFLEYGDESVSELVSAQLAVQNTSNIISKLIEDQRIGLSYLEKSSRYVAYNKKVSGSFLYARPEKIGISGKAASEYSEVCDSLFEFYSDHYKKAQEYFSKQYPIEEVLFPDDKGGEVTYESMDSGAREIADKSYHSAVRARALDDLRALLPASTLTNIGISGNGRSFIYLIQRLKSSRLPEASALADEIFNELSNELPELINASTNSHGKEEIEYLSSLRSDNINGTVRKEASLIELLDWDREPESAARVLSIEEFSRGGNNLSDIYSKYRGKNHADLAAEIELISRKRKNRRQRPPRAFEACSYFLQLNLNYGAFRDLQRHRFFSIERGFLSDSMGYDIPPYFRSNEDTLNEYRNLMKSVADLHRKLRVEFGSGISQYAITYSYRYPVSIYVNLRELVHFCELRSTPQSHYDLRAVSAGIFNLVKEKTPALSKIFRFVDTSEYSLGRLRSEQKKEKKLRDLK
ncbi:MAG: FAD-dependent thymidylate synthase [Candidatus Thermoplasmatota archaeon]|nr:FAD-dependent thymidylate synthase [Candidatus Thermoplasmatota archaeon]